MKTALVRCLPAVLLAVCCSQPSSREYFIRSDGSGEYAFEMEMADSLASYDISFFTRIDRSPAAGAAGETFPIDIVWRSPSGRYYSESVIYLADSVRVRYRSGLRPPEYGLWGLTVTMPREPEGIRGLGVICAAK